MNEHEELSREEWQQIAERMKHLEQVDRLARTAVPFELGGEVIDWAAAEPTQNWAERVALARRVIAAISHGKRIPRLVDVDLVARAAAVLRVHDRYGFPPDDAQSVKPRFH